MPGITISKEAVQSAFRLKIRKLLRRFKLVAFAFDDGITCYVMGETHTIIHMTMPTWTWLQPLLKELLERRTGKSTRTVQPRQLQDFQRDTYIVDMHDKQCMTFVAIARVLGVTAARVRQLYIRRRAQQDHNRKMVRLHTNIGEFIHVDREKEGSA